eukprot:RCo016968
MTRGPRGFLLLPPGCIPRPLLLRPNMSGPSLVPFTPFPPQVVLTRPHLLPPPPQPQTRLQLAQLRFRRSQPRPQPRPQPSHPLLFLLLLVNDHPIPTTSPLAAVAAAPAPAALPRPPPTGLPLLAAWVSLKLLHPLPRAPVGTTHGEAPPPQRSQSPNRHSLCPLPLLLQLWQLQGWELAPHAALHWTPRREAEIQFGLPKSARALLRRSSFGFWSSWLLGKEAGRKKMCFFAAWLIHSTSPDSQHLASRLGSHFDGFYGKGGRVVRTADKVREVRRSPFSSLGFMGGNVNFPRLLPMPVPMCPPIIFTLVFAVLVVSSFFEKCGVSPDLCWGDILPLCGTDDRGKHPLYVQVDWSCGWPSRVFL